MDNFFIGLYDSNIYSHILFHIYVCIIYVYLCVYVYKIPKNLPKLISSEEMKNLIKTYLIPSTLKHVTLILLSRVRSNGDSYT